jgi:Replication-relaxation
VNHDRAHGYARCPAGCPIASSPTGHFPRPEATESGGRAPTYYCNFPPLSPFSSLMTSRLSSSHLLSLADELPPRYLAPLPHLAAARLLTGAHLDRLLTEPELSLDTVGRVRRRIMARLAGAGLVAMLGRRVGGVRAGSAGHIYALTSGGHRFLALLHGEQPPGRIRHAAMPGPLFLAHALTISGIYVDLVEQSRGGGFQVASFLTEPHCWHPAGNGGYLRPDAYTALHASTHADYWWLEVDQGTESPRRLRDKARAYRQFFASGGVGPHDYPPRVLITAPDQTRADVITRAVTSDDGAALTVTTHHHAAQCMITALHQP